MYAWQMACVIVKELISGQNDLQTVQFIFPAAFLKQRTTQIKLVCDHVDLQHERYALCVMFSIQARINYYFHSSHSYEGEK